MSAVAHLRELLARLRGFARPSSSIDAELREEMSVHLEMHVEENLRRGMPPEAARRAAILALGNVTSGVESVRRQRSLPTLESLVTDLRLATRTLRAQPGFALGVILTLALGIAATVSMFTVLNAVLIRPLPYPESTRIVSLSVRNAGDDMGVADDKSLALWREAGALAELAVQAGAVSVMQTANGPRELNGTAASASYFRVMGVSPARGRAFTAEEDVRGAPSVIVLAEGLWRTEFGGDSTILGRTIVLDGAPSTVVGIMPASFASRAQFWKPLRLGAPSPDMTFYHTVLARLAPGATIESLQAALETIQRRAAPSRSAAERALEPVVMSLHERRYGSMRTTLTLLFAAVAVLLLITCANVANLSLARAVRRRREFSLRLALGAGRWRIVRYVLVECALLAATGAIIGLALAIVALRSFLAISPAILANANGIAIDRSSVLFTVLITALATVVFGLVPAISAARSDENMALAGASSRLAGSRAQLTLRRGLVVFELATALVLVIGAGLVARSFWTVATTPGGFQPEGAHVATMSLPRRSYNDTTARTLMLELVERVRRIPGVEHVALSDGLPLAGARISVSPDEARGGPRYEVVKGTDDYFATVGTRIVEGRGFEGVDRDPSARRVVVSAALARRLAPGRSALGTSITLGEGSAGTIVGVTEEVRQRGLEGEPSLVAFSTLMPGDGWRYLNLTVRAPIATEALARELTRLVAELDRTLVPPAVRPMGELVADEVAPRRFVFVLLATFAALAGALALLGLYSVMSYVVTEQTREIGIRIALGASGARVLRFVLGQGALLATLGVAIGLAIAWGAARTMESLVYGVGVRDALTFAGTAATLTVVALVASWIPARRASRVDPVGAMRGE